MGGAIAVAALVKLTPVVLLAYVWWRGARRAALVGAGLLALSMLPALVHWGPGILRDHWVQGLLPTLRLQIGWSINQSLDAFLLRLFDPNSLVATPESAPWGKTLLSVLLSLAVAGITLHTVARRRRALALLPLELGYVLLAILIVMKVTWVHTLAGMLFVWPVLMAAAVRAAEGGARWAVRVGVLASVGFFLSSAHFPVLWNPAFRHGPLLLLTGIHLYGVVILWATAGFVLHRTRFDGL